MIEENSINKDLANKIKNLKTGEVTQPIVIPGGFLILKLKDTREKIISIDVNDELNKLIKIKTNQQLNQFSNIYFNKIKKILKLTKYRPIIIVPVNQTVFFLKFFLNL